MHEQTRGELRRPGVGPHAFAVRPTGQNARVPETIAEARALFPVLERVAYLNAGTFGPLARPTTEAQRAELERDLREGRSGLPYYEHVIGLRAQARAAFAGLVGVPSEAVSLTTSTTNGCNIVLSGLDLGPDDEVITTTDEHFGLLGALGASPRPGRRRRTGPGRDRVGGHAPNPAPRAVPRAVDDRSGASCGRARAGGRVSRSSSTARNRSEPSLSTPPGWTS